MSIYINFSCLYWAWSNMGTFSSMTPGEWASMSKKLVPITHHAREATAMNEFSTVRASLDIEIHTVFYPTVSLIHAPLELDQGTCSQSQSSRPGGLGAVGRR